MARKLKPYELTAEARAQLGPWHERWLKIALNTDPMTDADREITRSAIEGLYRAAGLTAPPRERIVFVSSPFVAQRAAGFAAGIWHMRNEGTLGSHADVAQATADATRSATSGAGYSLAYRDTLVATSAAVWVETAVARERIEPASMIAAKEDIDATASTELSATAKWLLSCASEALYMGTYGGEWTGDIEWVEFMREVCGYERDKRVDYTKWYPYRDTALHSGFRFMHKEFCIVSDRPREIHIETVNGRGRLHRLDGPAKRYGDGWSIYAIHGVRVPGKVIEAPDTLTAAEILGERNAEVRRVMVDRFGAARLMREAKAELRNSDTCGKLWRLQLNDDEPLQMVEVVNSTPEPIAYQPVTGESGEWRGARWHKHYMIRVAPTCQTALEAVAWTFEMTPEQYRPCVET